jgi:hypothetical protein
MSQDRLNHVFAALNCSLLQYVGENSPWTSSADEAVAEQLEMVVKLQTLHIQRLADFLVNRYGYVPHANYTAEFTDLQYLSLSYLISRLVTDQQTVLETLEADRKAITNDAGASDMLSQLEVGVAKTVQTLKELDGRLNQPANAPVAS